MPSPELCRHVGKVLLHGLLEGQISVPTVADRGSLMVSTVLGKVNSEALHQALELVEESFASIPSIITTPSLKTFCIVTKA